MPIQIDPATGERVGTAPQIDPATGERVEGVSTMTVNPPSKPSPFDNNPGPGKPGGYEEALRPVGNFGRRIVNGAGAMVHQLVTPSDWAINKPASYDNPISGYIRTAKQDGPMQALTDAAGDAALMGLTGKVIPKVIGGAVEAAGSMAKLPAVNPEGVKLAATRVLAPGDPGQVLARALKPGVKYGADVVTDLNNTLKPILASKPKINGLSDFVDATGKAKDAQFAKYDALRAPHMGAPIDTTPLVDAQIRSIPATNKFETPSIVKSTAATASPYDMRPQTKTVQSPILGPNGAPLTRQVTTTPSKPSLGKVDAIREDTNAKLNSFYNKDNGDRNAALSNPETARLKAVNDGSRDLVYKKLADLTGMPEQDIRDMQKMYGNLSEVQKMAGNREVVFGRHDPVSLAEKVASGHGGPVSTMWNFGQQKLLRGLTDSDALIRSAVDRYQNPDGTPIYSPGRYSAPMFKLGTGAADLGRRLGTPHLGPSSALLLPKRKRQED